VRGGIKAIYKNRSAILAEKKVVPPLSHKLIVDWMEGRFSEHEMAGFRGEWQSIRNAKTKTVETLRPTKLSEREVFM